jgi:hypothetical protein
MRPSLGVVSSLKMSISDPTCNKIVDMHMWNSELIANASPPS